MKRLTPEREQGIRKTDYLISKREDAYEAIWQLLAEIDALRGERDQAHFEISKCDGERDQLKCEIIGWQASQKSVLDENERLKKIIAKQLCEEDGLGYEYTYVIALKEENQKLQECVTKFKDEHVGLIVDESGLVSPKSFQCEGFKI